MKVQYDGNPDHYVLDHELDYEYDGPLVSAGDVIDVPDAVAKKLLEQDIWSVPKVAAPPKPAVPAKTTPGA